MSIGILKRPFSKVYNSVKGINNRLESPFKVITKITGATTGAAGAVKGTADAIEALACQDGICFVVSCVGTAADSLQICASFVPGPNMTSLVTTPISMGCKVFVWCCRGSKIPWGNC